MYLLLFPHLPLLLRLYTDYEWAYVTFLHPYKQCFIKSYKDNGMSKQHVEFPVRNQESPTHIYLLLSQCWPSSLCGNGVP